MLKLLLNIGQSKYALPAAFRRLCVETKNCFLYPSPLSPAAFRRLCVETTIVMIGDDIEASSRLQAAVC